MANESVESEDEDRIAIEVGGTNEPDIDEPVDGASGVANGVVIVQTTVRMSKSHTYPSVIRIFKNIKNRRFFIGRSVLSEPTQRDDECTERADSNLLETRKDDTSSGTVSIKTATIDEDTETEEEQGEEKPQSLATNEVTVLVSDTDDDDLQSPSPEELPKGETHCVHASEM
jgi:hypothetical protein